MADNDLDKYLEDIGINVTGEEQTSSPEVAAADSESNETFVLEEPDYDAYSEPPSEAPPLVAPDVITEGTVSERAESFLVNLLLNFDPAYAVEIRRADEEEVYIDIFGGESGKIIGRDGRTLQALEYITNAVMNRQDGDNARVNIDVGGYKKRRDDRLIGAAQKAATQVRETGESYAMKPMNAAERRIVHMAIADDPTVISESEGEGRDRRVVVKPS